ncbi:MAG: hypothetical protein ACD_49C00022G0002 [uncultured bacterium (gcode 4)]|uniref:TraG P-loop domain-containing protein n=1 Tax=uncultured bacterium (gcode 4) TaxID=1234023 RepID=K2BWY9_9BACT|nr:MAG: hypothetical protein ACD_49C00022G0002 [uncultured bacterium (gcode 4)]
MSDKVQLIDLVNKNYTGDALGFEKEISLSQISPVSKIDEDLSPQKIEAPELPKKEEITLDLSKKLTREEAGEIKQWEKDYNEALAFVKDAIAPSMMKIDASKIQIWDTYVKTFFVYAYPDFLEWNWLSPLINWDIKFDLSIFVYPIEWAYIMKYLRKRLTELYSERSINQDKWLINDPALDAQIQDVEELRWSLTRWQEKYFHMWIYVSIYAESEEELKKLWNSFESLLSGRNILTKQAFLRSEQGFIATGPFAKDEVGVFRNISTKWLSTTFPFTSNSLSQDDGILYWINTHNNSLIIFDRFKTENANMTVFAKSWGWKSFAIKLEILRSLMLGTDVIVIDPENEYKTLVDTVWWSYLNINLNSKERINPFDLPKWMKDYDANPGDLLRWAIVNLIWLLNLMLWKITPSESSILEKALIITYSLKWITFDDDNIENKEIPIMKDLYSVLETMDWAKWLVERLEKYVSGIFSWIFSEHTNINLTEWLQVFSVRDLDEVLRPVAMYIILNYIWNIVRSSNKKRFLVVDEAWNIMQYEDSAKFMFWLVKRARKYNLWVTTITQDVEDFVTNKYWKAIVTNSSIQLLLKQSPASIDVLQNIFKLTEQEKYILLQSSVWQGLFFAGTEHVWIHILASFFEEKIITTNPNK